MLFYAFLEGSSACFITALGMLREHMMHGRQQRSCHPCLVCVFNHSYGMLMMHVQGCKGRNKRVSSSSGYYVQHDASCTLSQASQLMLFLLLSAIISCMVS